MEKVKMNKEDREKFATGMKTASPMELLEAAAFIDAFKEKMDPADLKFMHSHMGRRVERLLRNVVEDYSFADKPERRYERLLKLAVGYDLDSIAIVGLLHDLCKADFYKESTRNQKDEQGKWQQVPCYTFNDQFPAGHGEKSVMLIMRFIRLTDEETMAINWHMGGFDIRAHGYGLQEAWGKYPLAVMAHIADLEATWLDETGVKK